ncbi:MFS transporter [Amnibacterium kyonggiense]
MASDQDAATPEPRTARGALLVPAFALFWSATTVRAFGASVSGVAVQVLIVSLLHSTAFEVSAFNAIGVAPYLMLGLLVGALMDRWKRQRTLLVTSIGRALALATIPILLLCNALNFWTLAVVLLAQGVLTLFAQSAEQPFLPRLVPHQMLVDANARLGQTNTLATTVGPGLAGLLLSLISLPVLFVLDAAVNLVAAVLQSRIRVAEADSPARARGRHIGHDVLDGLRFTYRHRTLRTLAISVHVWFLGNSIVTTVFALYTLRTLTLPAWAFGTALAFGGLGGFIGAAIAPTLGRRLGAGHAILLGRALAALPWLLLALVDLSRADGTAVLLVPVAAVQFLFGLSTGLEDANDTGYRQSVAPDAMQGRMNSTIRTVNRAVFFVGALLTGLIATGIGYRPLFGVAALVFAAAAIVVLRSPLRTARLEPSTH